MCAKYSAGETGELDFSRSMRSNGLCRTVYSSSADNMALAASRDANCSEESVPSLTPGFGPMSAFAVPGKTHSGATRKKFLIRMRVMMLVCHCF